MLLVWAALRAVTLQVALLAVPVALVVAVVAAAAVPMLVLALVSLVLELMLEGLGPHLQASTRVRPLALLKAQSWAQWSVVELFLPLVLALLLALEAPWRLTRSTGRCCLRPQKTRLAPAPMLPEQLSLFHPHCH